MSSWMLLINLLEPRISDTLVSTRPWQVPEQAVNLSFHGDAERQWNKAGIEVTLSLPRSFPFPTVS